MTPPDGPTPWWKGARGEWFVVGQVALMALVFVGPRRWSGWPATDLPFAGARPFLGAGLFLIGGALFLAGVIRLGPNLTPLPRPKDHATFVDTGAYSLVRHPLYSGGLLLAFGWALWIGSWLTLGYVALLLAFLDLKSRREERWLQEKFTGYAQYQRRVRRLVPFLY